jgi:hypothetical protein
MACIGHDKEVKFSFLLENDVKLSPEAKKAITRKTTILRKMSKIPLSPLEFVHWL